MKRRREEQFEERVEVEEDNMEDMIRDVGVEAKRGSNLKKKRRSTYGLGCNQNRGQKGIEFKKKKKKPI